MRACPAHLFIPSPLGGSLLVSPMAERSLWWLFSLSQPRAIPLQPSLERAGEEQGRSALGCQSSTRLAVCTRKCSSNVLETCVGLTLYSPSWGLPEAAVRLVCLLLCLGGGCVFWNTRNFFSAPCLIAPSSIFPSPILIFFLPLLHPTPFLPSFSLSFGDRLLCAAGCF